MMPLRKCQPEHDVSIICVGDRVVLTARAATQRRVTGAHASELAHVWTVKECACGACGRGFLVCVDERASDGEHWRHFSRGSLRLVGQLFVDELPANGNWWGLNG